MCTCCHTSTGTQHMHVPSVKHNWGQNIVDEDEELFHQSCNNMLTIEFICISDIETLSI